MACILYLKQRLEFQGQRDVTKFNSDLGELTMIFSYIIGRHIFSMKGINSTLV